jgi:SAM-dependent methyltransferase
MRAFACLAPNGFRREKSSSMRPLRTVVLLAPLVAALAAHAQTAAPTPDVGFVPTPERVVDAMLRLARVTRDDTVYDLGSGDGRIVIAAAQRYGARGVGIDIDPKRIEEAQRNARAARVLHRVRFLQQDLFESDFGEATVVTLYLLPRLNLRLRPVLLAQLKPGTRVVSHGFDMGDWRPDRAVRVGTTTIYLWTIPARTGPEPERTVH